MWGEVVKCGERSGSVGCNRGNGRKGEAWLGRVRRGWAGWDVAVWGEVGLAGRDGMRHGWGTSGVQVGCR